MQTESIALLLDQQTQTLAAFESILKQEQLALIAGKSVDLPAYTEQKTHMLQRLQQDAVTLSAALRTVCGETETQVQRDWLAAQLAPSHPAVWANWRAVAASVQQLNIENGHLVEQHLSYQQQALAALLPDAIRLPLYSATGQRNLNIDATRYRGTV